MEDIWLFNDCAINEQIQDTVTTVMNRTNQTLLEQMKMTDVEILRRMELLGLTTKSLELLSRHKILVESNIDPVVEEFYEKQTAIDEISLLIGDADTLIRLRNAQRKYVIDLFSGNYDAEYVNNRLRIGMVHKRIGVQPTLYLSAINTLKTLVESLLKRHLREDSSLELVLDTLNRLVSFDTTLVFDTYIDSLVSEIETAKRRTEAYAMGLEEKIADRTRQLEEQAKIDPLTNIYNRRALQDILRKELAGAKRRRNILSIAYFDIDNFKSINDSFGHMHGDNVLKRMGQAMNQNIREVDIPCRYGGDEFCLVLADCDTDNAMIICDKIMSSFKEEFPKVSISIGIAETGPDDFIDGDSLLAEADDNMYIVKRANPESAKPEKEAKLSKAFLANLKSIGSGSETSSKIQ